MSRFYCFKLLYSHNLKTTLSTFFMVMWGKVMFEKRVGKWIFIVLLVRKDRYRVIQRGYSLPRQKTGGAKYPLFLMRG